MEEKMSDLRFFIEKKKGFDLEAKRLEKQFKEESNELFGFNEAMALFY